MPKYRADLLDRIFHALSDTTRRGMVERLARGPASVSEIARPLQWALPTVVQHLGVLEAAGVVTSTKVGRVRTFQLATDALLPTAEWIGRATTACRAATRSTRCPSGTSTEQGEDKMTDTIERSQTHATFVIERSYDVPVARVWRALSDTDERAQWFGGGDAFDVQEQAHDFRVGGHGIEAGQWHGGPTSVFRSTYTDIIDQVRIVFTYDMWVDDEHISTSLTTIALEPEGERSTVDLHRTGCPFRRPRHGVEGREEGSKGILDQLGAFVTGDGLTPGPVLRHRPRSVPVFGGTDSRFTSGRCRQLQAWKRAVRKRWSGSSELPLVYESPKDRLHRLAAEASCASGEHRPYKTVVWGRQGDEVPRLPGGLPDDYRG